MLKILHLYQLDIWKRVLADRQDYLIEQPTGSGKTVEAVAIAAALNAEGYGVLIAAPQEHIEENFTRRDYDSLRCGRRVLRVPAELVRAARDGDDGSVAEVRAFLEQRKPGYILACTHACLTRIKPPTGLPSNLRRWVLIVDEAHHVPALGLSQFVLAWRANGGRVLFFTATPFRADGDPVRLDDMARIARTLPQHMEEGFAPGRIESEVCAVQATGAAVSLEEFHGDRAVQQRRLRKRLVEQMVETWRRDRQPKLIVRVPSLQGGSRQLIEELTKAFQAADARVLNVSGSEAADKKRFLQALHDERVLNYRTSQYDVVLGVNRVLEGMDWPICSAVYCVGFPRAVVTLVQLLGRATRLKPAACPAHHRERAKIAFFVPCSDAETTAGMPRFHSRNLLLTCSYLTNYVSGEQWAAVKELGRGLTVTIRGPNPAPEQLAEDYPYLDPAIRSEIENALNEAIEALETREERPDDAALAAWVFHHRPQLSRAAVRQVIIEKILASRRGDKDGAIAEFLDAIRENYGAGKELQEAIRAAFESLCRDFESDVAASSETLKNLRQQLLKMTGRQVIKFGQAMSELLVLTPGNLKTAVLAHRRKFKSWPSVDSPGPHNYPAESWAKIDEALRSNHRHWPALAPKSLQNFIELSCMEPVFDTAVRIFVEETGQPEQIAAVLRHLGDTQLVEGSRLGALSGLSFSRRHSDAERVGTPTAWCIAVQRAAGGLAGAWAAEALYRFHGWQASRSLAFRGCELESQELGLLTSSMRGQNFVARSPEPFKFFNELQPEGLEFVVRMLRCHLSQTRDAANLLRDARDAECRGQFLLPCLVAFAPNSGRGPRHRDDWRPLPPETPEPQESMAWQFLVPVDWIVAIARSGPGRPTREPLASIEQSLTALGPWRLQPGGGAHFFNLSDEEVA